jgi:hypothetical protein
MKYWRMKEGMEKMKNKTKQKRNIQTEKQN